MPVRCPKCGYSNDPEFRFCGMCGATIGRQYEEPIRPKASPPPPPPPPPEKKTAPVGPDVTAPLRRAYVEERAPVRTTVKDPDYAPVSGPSFLGLDPKGGSQEPSPGYLLEDDEPSGHGRLWVGILLMLAVGGGLFWQWQHEGYPWNPAPKQSSSVSREVTDPVTPPATEATQPTPQPGPAEAKPEPPAQAAEDKPATAKDEKKDDKEDEAEAQPAQAAAKPEPPPAPVAKKAAPKPTSAKVKPSPVPEPDEDVDPSEALFIDGQKYLYGSGVPEDCGRARSKLMAAANQENSKAQSTVATMYATGHCMPRSLPSAYHWFALALHNDRDNGRLQRDLEVIWSQMTAEEKEMALKTR